jgi:hypothetical protein
MIGGITETIRNVPTIHEAKNDATLPNIPFVNYIYFPMLKNDKTLK